MLDAEFVYKLKVGCNRKILKKKKNSEESEMYNCILYVWELWYEDSNFS